MNIETFNEFIKMNINKSLSVSLSQDNQLYDFKRIIKHSVIFEEDEITENQINDLRNYFKSLIFKEPPNIKTVYSILFPNSEILRNEDVIIGRKERLIKHKKVLTAEHIGMSLEDLKEFDLQKYVNELSEKLNDDEFDLNDLLLAFEHYHFFKKCWC